MLSICLFLLYSLLLSYCTGRLISFLLKKDSSSFSWTTVGFFVYLGIVQLFMYIVIPLGVDSKLVFVIFYLVAILLLLACFVKKVDLKPTKVDLIALGVGILISIISVYRACGYTLGENLFDSVFYLSLVNESSVTPTLGGMWYYSGAIQPVEPLHDTQAFYYFFSNGIKLFRNLHLLEEIMVTPFYFWTSSILFYMLFGNTVVNIYNKFFSKSIWVGSLWTIMISYFFYKYFNISLAFIGNVWRIMCLSYIGYFLFDYLQEKEVKPLYLCALIFSGLCSVSSSGLFIAVFMIASLMVYVIYFRKDSKAYEACLLCLLAIYPFLFLTLMSMLSLLAAVAITILVICYYVMFKLSIKTNKEALFYKVHGYIVPFVLLGMLILSFFLQQSTYPYSHFFEAHSVMDMCNDYFGTYTIPVLTANIVLWVIVAVYIFFEPNKEFKKYLIINIVLFVNPFMMPFVVKFLADIVYFREFDIVFSMFTFALFCNGLNYFKWKKFIPIVCVTGMILCGYSSYVQFATTFSKEYIPKEDYNPFMRITNQEVELYNAFDNEIKNVGKRSKVISQVASTKGYISNIELAYDVFLTRDATPYETVKAISPSNLVNCLALRDYAEQEVYNQTPNYDSLNDDIMETDPDYIILRKDQYKVQEGEYIPIYLDVRGIADVIYENEKYVLMKVRL